MGTRDGVDLNVLHLGPHNTLRAGSHLFFGASGLISMKSHCSFIPLAALNTHSRYHDAE
jgi:hypothetical protein